MSAIVSISPCPILQFFDNNGRPCAGGSVLTQVGGVNTATYQDPQGNTALPNPIPLNSRGEISNAAGISCELFLIAGATYTFTLFDKDGNQLNQAQYVTSGMTVVNPESYSVLSFMTGVQQVDYLTGARTLDLTAPISNAITASNGKRLWFPPGNAKITSRMDFSNLHDMTLAGAQYASVLGVSGIIECTTFDTTCDHLVFDGLTFAGNSVAEETKAAVRCKAPYSTFKNNWFHNFNAGVTIEDESAEHCDLRFNLFSDIIGHTSGNGYASYTVGQWTHFLFNRYIRSGRRDIYLSGSTPRGARYCKAIGNVSVDCYFEAFALFNTGVVGGEVSDCIVSMNEIYNCGAGGGLGTAIGLDQNAQRNTITDNNIYTPVTGIYLNGSTTAATYPDNNTVSDNTIVDASGQHIRIINGSNNTVQGNKCLKISVTPSSLRAIEISSTGTPTAFPNSNLVSGNVVDPSFNQYIGTHPTTGAPYGILEVTKGSLEVTVPDGATTFDVSNCALLKMLNTAPTTFTNLTGGIVGDLVQIWFSTTNTTLPHGTNFLLAGGADFVSTAASSLTLRLVSSGKWLEQSRATSVS